MEAVAQIIHYSWVYDFGLETGYGWKSRLNMMRQVTMRAF